MRSKKFRIALASALVAVTSVAMCMPASAAAGSCYTMLSLPIYTLNHAQKMAYYWDATGRHSYYNTECTFSYVNSDQ